MRVLRISLTMALAAAAVPASSLRAAEIDRYRDLLQERQALLREKALLEIEAATAPTGQPYVLLDIEAPAIEFRIRGKTLKTYHVAALASDPRGEEPLAVEACWKRFPGALEVIEIQGGQPELVPPDPEAGREHGQLYSDPNQLRDQTEAVAVDSDAGVLGIDVPTDYWIRFDQPIVLNIRTEHRETLAEQALARLATMAGALRHAASRLLGGDAGDPNAPLQIWITLDAQTARDLHHSLVPGERVWIVPPSAPR